MEANTKAQLKLIQMPVTLSQIAASLRTLKRAELETLELLVDDTAIKTIAKSARQAKDGKLKEL